MATPSDLRTIHVLLYGRLRDRSTGAAVAGATVVLGRRLGEPDELRLAEMTTDAEGLFHFVSYPGYNPAFPQHRWGIQAGSGYRVSAPGSPWNLLEDLTLGAMPLRRMAVLDPVTRVGGRVLVGGAPAGAGSSITVTKVGVGPLVPPLSTDADGRFVLTDDSADLFGFGSYPPGVPGSISLTLQAAGPLPAGTSGPVPLTLRPGDRKGITIAIL